ncbi:MAG: hypothetical protein GY774_31545, partial [Planctomycetes bacterium]|nr:hypothetical protein [Planctomycetota bacterium]
MKKILILLIILFMVSSCSSTLEKRSLEEVEPDSLVDDATVVSSAVEKRSLKEVEPNSLVHDAKVVFPEAGDDHMAFGLWMPTEFWLNVFARDKTTSEHDKKAMLDAVSGISLLFLVQADLSPLGVPLFYSKEKIKEHLSVVARDSSGNSRNVTLLSELSPDLEMLINVLKAYTATFIGSMGNSMQF